MLLNNHRFLLAFVKLIHRHHEVKYGIQVSFSNDIGGGLCFGHFSCIVIGCEKIGKNMTIYQGCTIGGIHGKGAPVLGDGVVMYAGAKVVGKIKIGNNVVIGANAVVVEDIPDNAVVVGVPGKVVSLNALISLMSFFLNLELKFVCSIEAGFLPNMILLKNNSCSILSILKKKVALFHG